ncbi:MAG: hypothetical protein ABIT37_22925 [Luteolibacter sp.]
MSLHPCQRFIHAFAFMFCGAIACSTAHAAGDSGAPPNEPAQVEWNAANGNLRLSYHGGVIFDGRVGGADAQLTQSTSGAAGVEQRLSFKGKGLKLTATATGSDQMLAAETQGQAQQKLPMVRTSHGMSDNGRNNAVYDRKWDWELVVEQGAARLTPASESAGSRAFACVVSGDALELVFRPRFYQKYKGLTYFEPWTYQVREDSITGWSSWWAFMKNCSQKDCDSLLAVWKEKRLNDYGYRFIQLDDCYQNELGKGQDRPRYPGANKLYPSRGPATWLDWRKDTYPNGMNGYASACQNAGFEPGIWVGAHTTDNELINKHPEWFIRDAQGKPFVGPWISCGVDATNEQALDALVRPTFKGVKQSGFSYVKIDLMRHYLYDLLHHNPDYCKAHGVTPAKMYRKFLGAARKELGTDVFMLSCWGVLPESVGIADACRIGGDGYGPATMQQYNSWNGIVWRNDPDHCDVFPKFKPAEVGNVSKTDKVVPTNNDTVIRPALASIAGCLLMLSDKPDVYRDDRNIEGARRSSPVLFSVPGQLYDFDDRHSATVATVKRDSIMAGTQRVSCDADQFGAVCPWWLNEFNIPGVGAWDVLHRVNWGAAAPATTLAFADLGLDADADYLVYEFWTGKFLGIRRGALELPAAQASELRSYALRKLETHPQIVSTNRHLSQGGADLVAVKWNTNILSGKSKVVQGDRYELAIHLPKGFALKQAQIGGKEAKVETEGELLRVSLMPEKTGEFDWTIQFQSN